MKLKSILLMMVVFLVALEQEGFAQGSTVKQDSLQDAYYKSQAFKKQIARTQVITGGVLLTGGVSMIISGIVKKINYVQPTDAEGIPIPNTGAKGPGVGLIVTGGLSGVAGAILFTKGLNSIKKFRNQKGEVVQELTISSSGTGLLLRF